VPGRTGAAEAGVLRRWVASGRAARVQEGVDEDRDETSREEIAEDGAGGRPVA
jgi:hypothetical protein